MWDDRIMKPQLYYDSDCFCRPNNNTIFPVTYILCHQRKTLKHTGIMEYEYLNTFYSFHFGLQKTWRTGRIVYSNDWPVKCMKHSTTCEANVSLPVYKLTSIYGIRSFISKFTRTRHFEPD
jgi:hypothetical protein